MELLLMVIALHAVCLFQGLQAAAIYSNESVTYPASTDKHEEKESEFYTLSLSQVCSGTLGAFYHDEWVPVNLHSLSTLGKDDIGQICNSLGCGGVFDSMEKRTTHINTCLSDCVFINSTLHNCSTTAPDNCLRLMEIVCDRHAVRLTGGKDKCEGRVELISAGLWGSVCDDGWDLNGGNVICAQLDCGTAVHVTDKASWFGQGTGSVYISHLNCTGKEKNLWECSVYKDNSYCGHKEDAGVVCSESSNKSVTPSFTIISNQTNQTTESLAENTVESSSILPSATVGCIVLSIVLVFALFLIAAQCIYYRKIYAGGSISMIIPEANSNSSSDHYYSPDTSTNLTINNVHAGGFEAGNTPLEDNSETSSDSDYQPYYSSPPAETSNIHENTSGECYENRQAEEEKLLNPASQFNCKPSLEMKMVHLHNTSQPPKRNYDVSDSESTSSGECYENTQAEEEDSLNPVEETQFLVEQPPVINPNHQTAGNNLPQSYSQDQDNSSTSSDEAYENVPEIHDFNCTAMSEPPCKSSDDSDYNDIADW